MTDNKFVAKGLELVKQAVDLDTRGTDEPGALTLYKQSLAYFVTGIKYMSKSSPAKEILTQRVTAYMTRAEELKTKLAPTTEKKERVDPPRAVSTDQKTVADEEVDKLQAQLASSVIVLEKPNVSWNQVAGLDSAKEILKEAVVLPRKFPQLFTGNRKPWQGILLYGPPGTGKSYLAKAVATECSASCFLSVSSADLVCKWQGESEKLVRALFELARKQRPSIIFIDEIDSLCGARSEGDNDAARRIKTEFLVQMQGVGKSNRDVLVLGATNTPWELDPAIRRRFEKRVYIPLPDEAARSTMFGLHIGQTPHDLSRDDLVALGRLTDGYSGSDISVVVRDALYEPVRTCQLATHFRKVDNASHLLEPCSPSDPGALEMNLMDVPGEQLQPTKLTMRHFQMVLRNSKPTVSASDLTRVQEWTKVFGQDGGN